MIKILLLLVLSFSLQAAEDDITEYYAGTVDDIITIKVFTTGMHEPVMKDTEDYTVQRQTYFLKKLDDGVVLYEYDFKVNLKKAGTFTIPCPVYKDNVSSERPLPDISNTLKFKVSVTSHAHNGANEEVHLDN